MIPATSAWRLPNWLSMWGLKILQPSALSCWLSVGSAWGLLCSHSGSLDQRCERPGSTAQWHSNSAPLAQISLARGQRTLSFPACQCRYVLRLCYVSILKNLKINIKNFLAAGLRSGESLVNDLPTVFYLPLCCVLWCACMFIGLSWSWRLPGEPWSQDVLRIQEKMMTESLDLDQWKSQWWTIVVMTMDWLEAMGSWPFKQVAMPQSKSMRILPA